MFLEEPDALAMLHQAYRFIELWAKLDIRDEILHEILFERILESMKIKSREKM